MIYEPILEHWEIRTVSALILGYKKYDDVRWEAAVMGMDYLITIREEKHYATR